jgi:hypothetical protein
MVVTPRSLLCAAALACLLACGPARDPAQVAMEKVVRARVGATVELHVSSSIGGIPGMMIDFEAMAATDSTQAVFDSTARDVARLAIGRYPRAGTLSEVKVSAGHFLGPGVFQVRRQRIFKMADLASRHETGSSRAR